MRRFARNRWWAFILTLCVLFASNAAFTSPSYGEGPNPLTIGDGGSGTDNPGDPDGPSGPNKNLPTRGRSARGNGYAHAPVGDGDVSLVWSWRFHVALQLLKIRWMRF